MNEGKENVDDGETCGKRVDALGSVPDKPTAGAKYKSSRVMIVEDVAALREALRTYLEQFGYAVTSAGNFDDALQTAHDRPPDVAVCDRQLGEERDGIDVARALQRLHGSRVIFVSASSIHELRAQTTDLDVTAYLKKPVLPGRIKAAVRLATECRNEDS